MRIGILGGTFNPPHIGHLILAQDVVKNLSLDKIFFIPSNSSLDKQKDDIGADKRAQMLKLATSDNEKFQVLNLEIDRGGVSYTVDTVDELQHKYPKDEFYLIIGSDLANNLGTWKEFKELKLKTKIVVALRAGHALNDENSFISTNITQVGISSSRIRSLVKQGYCVRYLVTDPILDYIKKHNLYL